MPVDDRVTSLTGGGGTGQNGRAAFATTHSSVVLTAQQRSPAADEALEKLCRTYWWPLYGFVRRNGFGPEEAQDLTQGFSLYCSNGGISTWSAAKKDGCVRICSCR